MIELALWLVPALILAGGLWQPRWALYVFVSALPFFGAGPGGPNLQIACIAVLALFAVALLRGRSPEANWRWPGAVAGVWLLVGLAALTPWPRPPATDGEALVQMAARLPLLHGHEPLFGWAVIVNLVLGLMVGWAVLRLASRADLPRLALALSVGMMAIVVIGILVRLGWIDLWQLRPVPRSLDDPRMQSVWVDPRRLAEYLILVWPFALIWQRFAARSRRAKAIQLAAIALAAVGLMWSLQRGAWIALAGQLAVLALLDRRGFRRWLRPLSVIAVLAVLLVVAIPELRGPLLKRVVSMDDSSRIHYSMVALDLFRERPALGWGPGSWSHGYDRVADDFGGWIRGADTAHGLPTQILAERGIVGLAAFTLLLLTLAVRSRPPDSDREVHLGLTLAAAGFLVYGVFQYIPYLPTLEWLLWLLAAMWVVATQESVLERKLAVWGGAGVLLAALAALPWQHSRPWQKPPRVGLFGWEKAGERTDDQTSPRPLSHRWISDYAAVRLAREGGWLSFTVIDGHPDASAHHSHFKLWVDGELVLEEQVPDRWSRCQVRVPRRGGISTLGFESEGTADHTSGQGLRTADGQQPQEPVLIEIEVEPGFRPFRDLPSDVPQPSRDVRLLGMVLGNTCDSVLCWDDPIGRTRALQAGVVNRNGCFPDTAPQPIRGSAPTW